MMKIQKYKAKAINREHEVIVEGYYLKTPLTDENSNTNPDVGWFFLSDGQTRHCIQTEEGVVWVIDPETLEPINDLKE